MLKTPVLRRDSAYSTSRAVPPPEDESDNLELQRHLSRAEKELEAEFGSLQTHLSQPRNPAAELMLTKQLNRAKQRRVAKSAELERLKGVFAAGEEASEKTHNRFTSEIKDECEAQIASLEKEITVAQAQLESEETQTDILLAMKDRMRATALIMKDRMLYYEYALKKLAKQHKSSVESQRVAETCEVITRLERMRAKSEFDSSAAFIQQNIAEGKSMREKIEQTKKKSLNRISRARMHSAHRASEREDLLLALRHDLEEHRATKALLQEKSEQLQQWRKKLDVIAKYRISRVLERQGLQFSHVPGEEMVRSAVQGYFRMIGTEASLTVQYQNLSQQSEEKQSECHQLQSEVALLSSLYDLGSNWSLGHRGDLEAQLQVASSRGFLSQLAEAKDNIVLDLYTKMVNLAQRGLRRMAFIHDRSVSSAQGLARMVASLSSALMKYQPARESKARLLPASRSNSSTARAEGDETPAADRAFVPGLPLQKAEAVRILELYFPKQCVDQFVEFYKEAQITNYFTDFEGLRRLADEKGGSVSLHDFFSILTQSAYRNFEHQIKFVFEANAKIAQEVVKYTGVCKHYAVRNEVLDFYARNNPDRLQSFEEDLSRKIETSSDAYDPKLLRKLKPDPRLAFTEAVTPSDSLPKLRFFEKSPPKAEHVEDPNRGKNADEEYVEHRYLEQSRSELKLGRTGPVVRVKPRKSAKERKFARFLSRETSPESDRLHDLLSSFKKSDSQLRRLKMKEATALGSLPAKLFLIPQSPNSLQRSFLRGHHSKSATASPSASTSAYGVSFLF